jgi:hypothetical protein
MGSVCTVAQRANGRTSGSYANERSGLPPTAGVLTPVRWILWPIFVLLLTAPAYGQTSAPVVSAERISEALQRSTIEVAPLPAAETMPTFKVKVESDWPLETPLEAIRRELSTDVQRTRPFVPGTAGGTPPLVTVDLLAVYGSIRKSIQQARRAHAEREARQYVVDDLAAFCAINDCSRPDDVAIEGVILAPSSAASPR